MEKVKRLSRRLRVYFSGLMWLSWHSRFARINNHPSRLLFRVRKTNYPPLVQAPLSTLPGKKHRVSQLTNLFITCVFQTRERRFPALTLMSLAKRSLFFVFHNKIRTRLGSLRSETLLHEHARGFPTWNHSRTKMHPNLTLTHIP